MSTARFLSAFPSAYTIVVIGLGTACTSGRAPETGDHGNHPNSAISGAVKGPVRDGSIDMRGQTTQSGSLPVSAGDAQARLSTSPRHAEWIMIDAGTGDSVRAWVVYPERRSKAAVVVVVHEIFGLSPWIRSVADQLAADGFIAIAPDLLTAKRIPGSPENPNPDSARAAIRTVSADDVHRQLLAVARYGMALPAALPRYGIVGFCWGGAVSFAHATRSPELGASVVYYGGSPPSEVLSSVRAPVLGLYGENDARVNSTIAPADSAMRAAGKTYDHHIFPGAGHGFLRAQDAQAGQNLAATREAWPKTVAWFRRHLGFP